MECWALVVSLLFNLPKNAVNIILLSILEVLFVSSDRFLNTPLSNLKWELLP